MELWRGKWALITGASAGIGWALAEQLGAGVANLILTARRRERLEALAEQLSKQHGVCIEVFPADLSLPVAAEHIFAFTEKQRIAVDLLVNNAGFGTSGPFHTSDYTRQAEMVQVNVAAVVTLTHLYLRGMLERRRGDILIVSSISAFQGVPYFTTYAATKAFDLLFAEALAEEVRRYGIRVCALCPGPTATEFEQVAGTPDRDLHLRRHAETAAKVAHVGLEALVRGKSYVISGSGNYLRAHIQRLVPRQFVTRKVEQMFRPPD
jgi:short-subunit dehydrogenase